MQITKLYNATAEKAAEMRGHLAAMGAKGARVRIMRNGALRLVIKSVEGREAARDALVLANACTMSGRSFTKPESQFAWNGATEIFVRFLTPAREIA